MHEVLSISWWDLAISALLLLIPIGLSWWLKASLIRTTLIAAGRMAGQLFLVGMVLVYFFEWNHPLLNVAWVMAMLGFATFSTIRSSGLNLRFLSLPVFIAFTFVGLGILILFNALVLDLDRILDARYLLVIGGLLIGNAMKGNVIGIARFYESIDQNQEAYQQRLGMGATPLEARMPFFREAYRAALQPQIASMATMGIVFLPGLMTGQVISGVTPLTAVQYQVAIVLTIYAAMAGSVALAIALSMPFGFDAFDQLREGIFRKKA